jgi:hypothetical protein
MAQLHMTRVAIGCADYGELEAIMAAHAQAGERHLTTRNRPRRADELIGGYIYFIIRHTIVARAELLRFDDREDGRTDIVCSARLERVHPQPKRAHQGWRYLAEADAPRAVGDDASGIGELPPDLYRELAELSLI